MPSAPKKSTKSAPVEPTLVKTEVTEVTEVTKDTASTKTPKTPKTTKESSKNTDTKATKPTKSTKSTKSTKTVTDTTPTETTTAVEDVNVVIATDGTDPAVSISDNFSEFLNNFQKMVVEFSRLKTELRTLEKKTIKELKVVNKLNAKRKKKSTTRAPSGFVKPTKISDELATFLGKPFGSEMARTEVTREINAYIRTHELQDKNNGRKINPDSQLASLLKITEQDELTYFNLQRFMSPHFAKNVATTSPEVTTA